MTEKIITVQEARKKLGKIGEKLTDKEIEKLRNNLYSLVNQLLDNYFSSQNLCKKQ